MSDSHLRRAVASTSNLETRACGALRVLCAMLALGLMACSEAPVDVVTLSPKTGTLERGRTLQLTAELRDSEGAVLSDRKVTWSSSNPSVAEVDAMGQVTGRGRGTATLTATSEGKSATSELQVFILYRSITSGDLYSCDVGSVGVATCWGRNAFGVFGSGDETDSTTPVAAKGGLAFTQLSSSPLHTCGITESGAAWCWGSNSVGQGGTGNHLGPNLTPKAVTAGLEFTSISAGGDHTCGITRSGQAYCWGSNGFGQLGTGTADTQLETPTIVAGGLTFKSISAGANLTCAVTTSNQAYCWGSDADGELGDGGPISYDTQSFSRVPVRVAGGSTFASVSAGTDFACGITTSGGGYCWGRNDVGRLGNGGDVDSSSPVLVAGALVLAQVSAGATHACAVDTAGKAWCWGANNEGELGVSAPADLSRVPVRVSGGGDFAELTASKNSGSAHSCGISADRLSVRCWGRNNYGQLGNGSTSEQRTDVPTVVTGQAP